MSLDTDNQPKFVTRFKSHKSNASNTSTQSTTVKLSYKDLAKLDVIVNREGGAKSTRAGLVTSIILAAIQEYEYVNGEIEVNLK